MSKINHKEITQFMVGEKVKFMGIIGIITGGIMDTPELYQIRFDDGVYAWCHPLDLELLPSN